jgi:tRNA threonylcarbamoyladenosine biosynthesis protein TsaE
LDVYRLRSPAEFLELGVLESLPEALMLVEWADRVADHLPSDRLEVELTPTSESTRRVAIRALGPQAAVVAARLRSLG